MKIKEYSELITMIAKIEDKKSIFESLESEFHKIDGISDSERWSQYYEKTEKARKSLKKAYSDFKKKIETPEFEYLANNFRYSLDKSNKNFYYFVSRAIMKESTNVELN